MLSTALEAAIIAQCGLFTAYAFLIAHQGRASLYYLAALTGLLALMMAGNVAESLSPQFAKASDVNLVFELMIGPVFFLYVQQSSHTSRSPGWLETLHALPMAVGLLVRTVRIEWVDATVLAVVFGYMGASAGYLFWRRKTYGEPFIWFASVLIAIFCLSLASRLYISIGAGDAAGFRQSAGYPALLATVLVASWVILFTALRWPDALGPVKRIPMYLNKLTGEDTTQSLKDRLDALLRNEQPHLQPDLTLSDIASTLGESSRQVSQLVNWAYGMNFSAYMNFLRVRHAADQLAQNSGPDAQSIKTIMYNSGFRSKSAFNREFQRVFKMSPSRFQSQRHEPSVR